MGRGIWVTRTGAGLAAVALAGTGAVQAQQAGAVQQAAQVPGGLAEAAGAAGDYRLGPDDQLEVTIYGQPDMPLRLRIKQDGSVSLPLMGSVTAAGETPVGLAEKIRGALVQGGYLRDPRVNVEVTSYVSRSVTLLGAVVRPGIYPLQGPQPLSRVLATAGGQREGSETVLLRRGDAAPQRLSIEALARGGAGDPVLQPGDLLFVPAAEHFYIYGQVRSPGSFPIRAGMTFRQALSQGGGPNDAGTQNRIRLTRRGQQSEIADLDAPIEDGDVMFVRERLF
ncbi:polysaccharide biosynthesis/export family protein [Sphingomonas desiccabilis]|uniref:Sugar ABC transporter substrate-binding protein n=1 Tax=Sphingomonas desiccabilis TaxID=429134 RepID=A0A4V1QPN1_9SPHN|nr:polysaccharide biosynthesis/export family protein [Sphingomonas desiccabilis]MBB3909681.1 polysaccharide export outer membrane protein [Sphingomonas desiccabilis]RXZ34377.1 sugar ABC transporter substrate-binding protein [Sphingomonas desiccabilis]